MTTNFFSPFSFVAVFGSGMQLFSIVFIRLFLQFVVVFATSVVYYSSSEKCMLKRWKKFGQKNFVYNHKRTVLQSCRLEQKLLALL
jgi:hypothetical protein